MSGFQRENGEFPIGPKTPVVSESLSLDEARPPVMERGAVDGNFVPPLDALERTQFLRNLGGGVTKALSERFWIDSGEIES